MKKGAISQEQAKIIAKTKSIKQRDTRDSEILTQLEEEKFVEKLLNEFEK